MRPIASRSCKNTARDIEAQELAAEIANKIGIKKLVKKCKSARHLLSLQPCGKETHEKIIQIYKKIFGGIKQWDSKK